MDDYISHDTPPKQAKAAPENSVSVGWWRGSGLKIRIEVGAAVITIIGGLITLVPPIRDAATYLFSQNPAQLVTAPVPTQPTPTIPVKSEPKDKVIASESSETSTQANRAIFGAASLNLKTGTIYVIANQIDPAAATKISIRMCGDGCQPITTFQNQCLSVARRSGEGIKPDNWVSAMGSSAEEADEVALQGCTERMGSCKIRLNICSPESIRTGKQ
ncbi:DUF4189 domain-containing protein [Neorhizobium sp. T6_25]|uniref:DUF4189 domain-containing protein n=1 Tax=Neorhizobium sp. T6_25 TaxID=2093833 RepID=UPI000CFA7662|nr:DUF4189 domain-containing protein [Neorhizobium sp. T6_25]